MEIVKTVDNIRVDPLIEKQRRDVAEMRTSLLTCDVDTKLAGSALKKVAVLQVYHQLSRIIRYTEMCDKIEDKLYESIDSNLDRLDSDNAYAMNTLLTLQERLQKILIESNKLFAPYLDLSKFVEDATMDVVSDDTSSTSTFNLDATSRERLRNSANQVLLELNVG